jgi:excisionase family DNA binding protein
VAFEHKPFYSPAEVAAILGVSPSYINSMVDRGEIDAIRLSPRVTRIPYGSVMSLVGQALDVRVKRRSAGQRTREREALHNEDVPAPRRHLVAG